MSHETRSKQKADRVKRRKRRDELYKAYCDHFAKTHAMVLYENDGVIYTETNGVRQLLHRAIDRQIVWREAWELLREEKLSDNSGQKLAVVQRIFRAKVE